MTEQEREKDEMEVGLYLQSQWERTVIYTHLTGIITIKGDPYYFTRRIRMVFSFVPKSFIILADIFFPHYMGYSAPYFSKSSFHGTRGKLFFLSDLNNKQYLS